MFGAITNANISKTERFKSINQFCLEFHKDKSVIKNDPKYNPRT